MTDDPHPDADRNRLLRLVREEVARLRSLGGGDEKTRANSWATRAMSSNEASPTAPFLSRIPETEPPVEVRSEYGIGSFLAYHDEDFVRNAYRGILHREPDVDGFTAFLTKLRAGTMSKAEILGRLRYSREGRAARVRIRGLLLPLVLRMTRRVPVVGWLVGIVHYFLRLPTLARNHERLEAAVFQRQLESRRQFNAAQARTEQELASMARVIGALDAKQQEIFARQDTVKTSVDAANAKYEQTERSLASLQHSAAQKAEVAQQFIAVERGLEFKADNERLTQLTNYVMEVLRRKAEQTALDALAQEIDDRLRDLRALTQSLAGSMASREDVETLALDVGNRIGVALREVNDLKAGKADGSQLDAAVQEIRLWLARMDSGKADAPETTNAIGDLKVSLNEHRRALADQQRRIAVFLDEAKKRLPDPMTEAEIRALVAEEDHLLDAFYVSFEDRFRGTVEDIKERVAIYLPVIREARAGTPEAAVLDIGCGRGEWLELLKENGLIARGVDINRVTVRQCTEGGLEVVEGEAIGYLRGLGAGSLGAITGMHVIEHIAFDRLIALFDEALRVLRPGGVLIVETPNPENLIVGACNFYCDPTHKHPLPPEPTRFVAEARGFVDTQILRLHPFPTSDNIVDGPASMKERLNALLYGPQDYAIVARKAT